uniref:Uncharacterized protein n=1 Tax=Branchiostoma floridae TaxID=7739 RepID=C3ZGR6_BRAFL|eukprot:XP_002592281.1 hypothetical protein BRAFLDRAFT_71022 [Branchiostoma floridae]
MTSLANKLEGLELCLKSQHDQEVGYGQALREAIIGEDLFSESEVLKSLGDLHLENGKRSKNPAEFDKAAALYAAALLRCTDADMGRTLEHRIGYMEKLSRQLLQGYTPQYQLSTNNMRVANNVLHVTEICDKLDRDIQTSHLSVEDIYTETLVTAMINSDMFLEIEVLKSLGDFYLKKGKETLDLSQFSKAAAIYKKALTKCEDPETKLTLEHRIKYTEKVMEAVRKQATPQKTSKAHQMGNVTRIDAIQDQSEISQYKHHLKEGDSCLDSADLNSAEQHFAAALKMVHVIDPTAQQYQTEVDTLCKLGDVYSKRGQETGDGGDFVKAAALYNAAIARSEDQILNGNIATAIKEVEMSFIKCVLDTGYKKSTDDTEKHKKQLKEMRDQIKLEMETIDQQLDPYVHDEDDPCHRTGNSILLEFAILVEEEREECLVYFRKLTHYLHLKVVNIGETILPALGIKSLNDFYSENPIDNWYYDSVTPRGFAFDGSMPKASKTPLGRQETLNKPPSELICTPNNMALILKNDVTIYLKEGYHLATILRNPCLIAGDQDLMDIYMAITEKILQADEAVDCLALSKHIEATTIWKTIEEIENQQMISPNNAHHLTVLTSISAELRLRTYIANGGQKENLSALASMETAAQSHALKPVFHVPNEKQLFRYYFTAVPLKQVLSKWSGDEFSLDLLPELYNNSPYVKGIMYHQLCKYTHAINCYSDVNKGHEDPSTNTYTLTEQLDSQVKLVHALHMGGHYLESITCNNMALQLFRSVPSHLVVQCYPYIAGLLLYLGSSRSALGDQKEAISCYEQALPVYRRIHGQTTAHVNTANLLNNMAGAWSHLGEHRKALGFFEEALQMYRTVHGESASHADIALALNNIGGTWTELCDYRKAISYHEQALQMQRSVYGQSSAHPHIAVSLNNLGDSWRQQCDYRKSLSYHEQALQMKRSIYGQTTKHPDIAISLNNLGLAWAALCDNRKAIRYLEQAQQMQRSVHTAHTEVSSSLTNLGGAWENLGDYRKAISYHEEALQMSRSKYGESTTHPDIAVALNMLGLAWYRLDDYRKAFSYFQQALKMHKSIHGQTVAHPHIAMSLTNMGLVWEKLGDYVKAISYQEQALQMLRRIYGHTTAHHEIAISLNNLATAWICLCNDANAISFLEEALQMYRQIYDQTAHPDIAITLFNLGTAWEHLDQLDKASSCYEEALQMNRSIFGQHTALPHTALLLLCLGSALDFLGQHKKAISYLEQALQMFRSIHGQKSAHHKIAFSLSRLGYAWYQLSDHKKANSLCQEALAMAKLCPQENPNTIRTMHTIQTWTVDLPYMRTSTMEGSRSQRKQLVNRSLASFVDTWRLQTVQAVLISLFCTERIALDACSKKVKQKCEIYLL